MSPEFGNAVNVTCCMGAGIGTLRVVAGHVGSGRVAAVGGEVTEGTASNILRPDNYSNLLNDVVHRFRHSSWVHVEPLSNISLMHLRMALCKIADFPGKFGRQRHATWPSAPNR